MPRKSIGLRVLDEVAAEPAAPVILVHDGVAVRWEHGEGQPAAFVVLLDRRVSSTCADEAGEEGLERGTATWLEKSGRKQRREAEAFPGERAEARPGAQDLNKILNDFIDKILNDFGALERGKKTWAAGTSSFLREQVTEQVRTNEAFALLSAAQRPPGTRSLVATPWQSGARRPASRRSTRRPHRRVWRSWDHRRRGDGQT